MKKKQYMTPQMVTIVLRSHATLLASSNTPQGLDGNTLQWDSPDEQDAFLSDEEIA